MSKKKISVTLSQYNETAAQVIAEKAAMFVYNGFPKERLQLNIDQFLGNASAADYDQITARARYLFTQIDLPRHGMFVTHTSLGYSYTSDLSYIHSGRNCAWNWVSTELSYI